MADRVRAAQAYLRETFEKSDYMAAHPEVKRYRLEHSLRVANLGRNIARAEGLDAEALAVACLLHDISYAEGMVTHELMVEHGRISARIARPFVEGLYADRSVSGEILFGIAAHSDGKADFPGEETALSASVGDADNIDRFDVFRIHEKLVTNGFLEMAEEERRELCDTAIRRLDGYAAMTFATATATALWADRVAFQREFFRRMLAQLDASGEVAD